MYSIISSVKIISYAYSDVTPEWEIILLRFVYKLFFLASLLITLNGFNIAASHAEALNATSLKSGQGLNSWLSVFEDSDSTQTIEQQAEFDWQYIDNTSSFGYTSSTYWFKLQLNNDNAEELRAFLAITYPSLDSITFYQSTSGNQWKVIEAGDHFPFQQRPVVDRNFIFPFALKAEQQSTIIFKVHTTSSMQLPLAFWHVEKFYEHQQAETIVQGLYFGAMIIMVLYNLLIFLSTRETSHLFYVFYASGIALFFATIQGYGFQYLWPSMSNLNDYSMVYSLCFATIFGVWFTHAFLKLSNTSILSYMLNACAAIVAITVLLSYNLSYHTLIQIIIVVSSLALSFIFITSYIRWFQGHTAARFFSIAWTTHIIGGIFMSLNKFDIIPYNVFTDNIFQLGTALESALLSLALADRLNHEKKRHSLAQKVALDLEREARISQQKALEQEKAARMAQKEATELLEQRVYERTLELQEANKKLELISVTDPLTGLYNRRYFDEMLQKEFGLALRKKQVLGIIIIDIDHFKSINDTYGHPIGDEVIKALAGVLKKNMQRSADLAARFGGEEFVVILPNTDSQGALYVAENIRKQVEDLDLGRIQQGLSVKASLGVYAAVPDNPHAIDSWLEYADQALYEAKKNGRNQVRLFTES